ncbi:MAG TPA: EscU/YscU/HrcU family type III secretion system export apparatus switch protein [Treponemataceae bacterium]|nr:EscU/YscU/HrcU family type III secretion system export apparatus switch protein [Treponemataceae bacterium]
MKYAGALKYPEGADAPLVVCVGRGKTAHRITKIAQEENIPVFYDEDTARVLTCCEINSYVPEKTWEVLAGIFAYIQKVESNENKK